MKIEVSDEELTDRIARVIRRAKVERHDPTKRSLFAVRDVPLFQSSIDSGVPQKIAEDIVKEMWRIVKEQ